MILPSFIMMVLSGLKIIRVISFLICSNILVV
nr:MAG TPA: hypothetical protein [Microviridae sp.]